MVALMPAIKVGYYLVCQGFINISYAFIYKTALTCCLVFRDNWTHQIYIEKQQPVVLLSWLVHASCHQQPTVCIIFNHGHTTLPQHVIRMKCCHTVMWHIICESTFLRLLSDLSIKKRDNYIVAFSQCCSVVSTYFVQQQSHTPIILELKLPLFEYVVETTAHKSQPQGEGAAKGTLGKLVFPTPTCFSPATIPEINLLRVLEQTLSTLQSCMSWVVSQGGQWRTDGQSAGLLCQWLKLAAWIQKASDLVLKSGDSMTFFFPLCTAEFFSTRLEDRLHLQFFSFYIGSVPSACLKQYPEGKKKSSFHLLPATTRSSTGGSK